MVLIGAVHSPLTSGVSSGKGKEEWRNGRLMLCVLGATQECSSEDHSMQPHLPQWVSGDLEGQHAHIRMPNLQAANLR